MLVLLLLAACQGASTGSTAPSVTLASPSADALPSARASPSPQTPATTQDRLTLPPAFPVLPGAVEDPPRLDDRDLVAAWHSDRGGSAAYDFYVEALPAAGYPIVGLYPGGAGAIIRFRAASGAVWQMVAQDAGDGTVRIEIRADRP